MSFLSELLSFKKKPSTPPFPGVLPDFRSPADKEKDYIHEEIMLADKREAMAGAYVWKEKPISLWKRYPIKNQDGSSSCVAQAISKALAIENSFEESVYLELSAAWIYAHRTNYPGEGMNIPLAMDFVCDKGATLEYIMPSNNKSEQEMNNYVGMKLPVSTGEIAKIFKQKNFVEVMSRDIDEIAALLEQHPLVMAFTFSYREWNGEPVILDNAPPLRHLVTGIEATLWNGNKRIIIDDSWSIDATPYGGKRLISPEFLMKRCFYIGYFIDLSNTWMSEPTKPRVNFTKDLKYGMSSDQDVKILQDVLKYEKFFPATQDSTGNFFGLTGAAVSKLRVKYGLDATPVFDYKIRSIINNEYK